MPGSPITLDIPASKHVTVSVAAFAAGVSVDCIRGWLKSGSVSLLVPRRCAGAWLRISPADVVRLAVMGHLIRYGFKIADADSIVRERFDTQVQGIVLVAGDVPWHLLVSQLLGRTLIVAREPFGGIAISYGRSAQAAQAALHMNLGEIAQEAHRRVRGASSTLCNTGARMCPPYGA